MTGALVFLVTQSWRNATWAKLRRLRQPRYAIVTAVGLLYFGQMFLQSGRGWQVMGLTGETVRVLGGVLLLLAVTRPWWWPKGGRGGLGFSQADIHLLFQAPLSRRDLVGYRIFQSQGALAAGALIFTIITQPPLDASLLFRFVGIWCLTGIVSTHAMVVTLSRSGVVRGDTGSVLRRWVPAVVTMAAVVIVGAAIVSAWPSLVALEGAQARIQHLGVVLSTGLAGIVMWPFTVLFQLPAASDAREFASVLPVVLLMWAVAIAWVLWTDAAFEETAADQAEKVAVALSRKTMTVAPKKAGRAWFVLRPIGRPEVAFFWKNLIAAGYTSKIYLVFAVVWIIPVGIGLRSAGGALDMYALLAVGCLGLAAMTTMVGAMQVSFDLRQDLASLALIKSWPVSGATIVRGEVLTPACVLSGFAVLMILLGAAVGSRSVMTRFGVGYLDVSQWAVAAACMAAAVILMQVVVQNAIAVMFPAWVRIGPKAVAGMEAMGQQMVMMFGTFLLLPILAIPAVAAGAIAWFALSWSMGSVPFLIPAVVTALVLLIESALAIEMVGRVLDRTDISAVGP